MRIISTCFGLSVLTLCLSGGIGLGNNDPVEKAHVAPEAVPSPATTSECTPAKGAERLAGDEGPLGRKLFGSVTKVCFIGPSMPANPDGTLGGLVADHHLANITIYERFIVRELVAPDGIVYRTVESYDKLGSFEQRIEP